jgi:hypothetical protein
MNKYQRALKGLKEGRTWKQVAEILSEGLGETVWPADPWNVYEGQSNSIKVETALQNLELVSMPGPRWRLAADFDSEDHRQAFKEFYDIDNETRTFTDWVHEKYLEDIEHDLQLVEHYAETEYY